MNRLYLIFLTLFILNPIAPAFSRPFGNQGETGDRTQNTQNAIAQIDEETLRAACSGKRFDLLPIPFSDVSPDHWAFEAVMNLYYCIGLPPKFQADRSYGE
ncbi:hypothetical protein [Lyngbya sp. CCY1209]|jgi:hypothetical protein|uniref:hypothetical protein n=1 Tax=Lyngbya sp. CCY1209 TaxID=2886103 RepID=UPI002D206D7E|nr:hypothetical protein [Lyngbya sp. CCY1209]MEB3884131.1 hypothetical protein [Lyngbya sp. CCY1209]